MRSKSHHKFSWIVKVFVTVSLVVTSMGLHSVVSAEAETSTNDSVSVGISVKDKKSGSNDPRTDYYSGENISTVVNLVATGTTLNIPRATLTVCATAMSYENLGKLPDSSPKMISSAVATSSTRYVIYDGKRINFDAQKGYGIKDTDWVYHPGDKFCIDYFYEAIVGGMVGGFATDFSFLNGATPNGATRVLEAILKDADGAVRAQDSLTFKAIAQSQYTSGIHNGGTSLRETINGKEYPVYEYRAISERHKTHTPAYPFTLSDGIYHGIFADPVLDNSAPSGTGSYDAQKIRYVVKLPQGSTIRIGGPGNNLAGQEWVYDASTNTATWEGTPKEWYYGPCWGHKYCRPLVLEMFDVPVYADSTKTTKALYSLTSQITLDPGMPTEHILPEHTRSFAFRPVPSGDGITSWEIIHQRSRFGEPFSFSDEGYGYNSVGIDPNNPAQDKDGSYWFMQINNSNSDTTPNGGVTAQGQGLYAEIQSLKFHDMDSRLYFNAFYLPKGLVYTTTNSRYNTPSSQLVQEFNDADGSLYGVKSDGTMELIQGHIRAYVDKDLYVPIKDTARKYSELKLIFTHPYKVDNVSIRFYVTAYMTPSEEAKWLREDYPAGVKEPYPMHMGLEWRTHGETTFRTVERDPILGDNSLLVQASKPRTSMRSGLGKDFVINKDNQVYETSVGYDDCATAVVLSASTCARVRELFVTSYGSGKWPTGKREWKNLKHVVVLPPGVEYVRTTRTLMFYDFLSKPVEPVVVDDFKGTGRTALIYSYGDVTDSVQSYPEIWGAVTSFFEVDTTLQADTVGRNVVDYYVTWDNNDSKRAEATTYTSVYRDVLDLDSDGDVGEEFVHAVMRIGLTPPLEVLVKKHVSVDERSWVTLSPVQDFGGPVFYRYTVTNNTVAPLTDFTLLSVLPQSGDHKITSNADGVYVNRRWSSVGFDGRLLSGEHSAFETVLTRGLEDNPLNQSVQPDIGVSANDMFTFYYALTAQGPDLASVRDTTWLTKDQVAGRWAQVKSVKAVLNNGRSLVSGKTVLIYTSNQLAFDSVSRLAAGNSHAVSSLAMATNGVRFVEPAEVRVRNVSYNVSGVMFADANHNGVKDPGERILPGRRVAVITASGATLRHPDGSVAETVTDANGAYKIPVYTRGTYRVRFEMRNTSSSVHEQLTIAGTGAPEVSNHAIVSGSGTAFFSISSNPVTHADTDMFDLNPAHRDDIRNGGIYTTRDVLIEKVDNHTPINYLAGVSFELKWKQALPGVPDPATIPANQTVTTDNDGLAQFSQLPEGRYTLRETSTLAGYQLDSTPIIIQVQGSDLYTVEKNPDGSDKLVQFPQLANRADPVTTVEKLRVVNKPITGTISVKKVDTDDITQPLTGVKFSLYDPTGITISEQVTDNNGIATFTDVPYGTYTIKETATIPGYVPDFSDIRHVSITTAGQHIDLTNKPVTNRKITGNIRLTKRDSHTGKPLAGAIFTLTTTNGTPIATATSTSNGTIEFTNIPYGTYTITETTPPPGYEADGYVALVNIAVDGVQEVLPDVYNMPGKGSIAVHKVDSETGQALKGVVFDLFEAPAGGASIPADATARAQATTNADGVAWFKGLPYGRYVVRESATVEGYVMPAEAIERTVEIGAHGQVVQAETVSNDPIRADVIVKKVNERNVGLAGAVFELTRSDGTQVLRAVSDHNGHVIFPRVLYGTWTLREVVAPQGYELNDMAITVEVVAHHRTVDAGIVVNTSVKLARTGADIRGVMPIFVMLILLGIGLTHKVRRSI